MELKNPFDERFLAGIDLLIKDEKVKNASRFSTSIGAYANLVSDIKKGKRSVTMEQVATTIGVYNLNANFFFKEKESLYDETDLDDNSKVLNKAEKNSGIQAGNKSMNIQGGKGGVHNNGTIMQAAGNIINELPKKFQKETIDFFKEVQTRITTQEDRIEALKKIADEAKEDVRKKDDIIHGKDNIIHEKDAEIKELHKELIVNLKEKLSDKKKK